MANACALAMVLTSEPLLMVKLASDVPIHVKTILVTLKAIQATNAGQLKELCVDFIRVCATQRAGLPLLVEKHATGASTLAN